jgi:2,3-bisphosphoglycerate-dependent phosphoglycerate mutase
MTVHIVFETHSYTEDNERGIATGWLPGRLSELGRQQARLLGERRIDDDLDAVFTSDLGRAVETVNVAFPDPVEAVLCDWRLRECNYGDLNGSPADGLHRTEHVDVRYPSGESWREAVARVGSFLNDVLAWWDDRRVLIIGHTATRWGLDHLINGEALEDLVAAPFSWQQGWEYRIG